MAAAEAVRSRLPGAAAESHRGSPQSLLRLSSAFPLKDSDLHFQSETPIRTALTGDGGVA